MSVIVGFRIKDEAFQLLTDCAQYDEEGIVRGFGSKVVASRVIPLAIATRGHVQLSTELAQAMLAYAEEVGFDAALDGWSRFLRLPAIDRLPEDRGAEFVFAGWSATSGPVAYGARTHARSRPGRAGSRGVEVPGGVRLWPARYGGGPASYPLGTGRRGTAAGRGNTAPERWSVHGPASPEKRSGAERKRWASSLSAWRRSRAYDSHSGRRGGGGALSLQRSHRGAHQPVRGGGQRCTAPQPSAAAPTQPGRHDSPAAAGRRAGKAWGAESLSDTTPPLLPCATCGKLTLVGDFVLVRRAEYDALLVGKMPPGVQPAPAVHRKSSLANKPDVVAFILAELPGKSVWEVVEAAQQRFGDEAPSKSAIYRFVDGLRRAR